MYQYGPIQELLEQFFLAEICTKYHAKDNWASGLERALR